MALELAMVKPVRIVTDGAADFPYEWITRFDIKIVPVYVSLGDKDFLDDGSLDHAWFYEQLLHGSDIPKTAAPSPSEFLRIYQQLADEGAEDIIGLFAASGVSSIYNNAQLAAQQLSSARVHAVDTGQVSMGMAWLVRMAAEAIEQGAGAEDVVTVVKDASVRTRMLGVLDSMEHLRRSGRVTWVTARFVELLQIKPLICFEHGKASLLGRVRTHQRALARMVELVSEFAPLDQLAVIHSRVAPELIVQLQDVLQLAGLERPTVVVEIGPVFGAHIGPRCLGVAFIRSREVA